MHLAPRFVLTGRLLSPFVRRVAVTLTHLGIGFERQILSAIDDVAEIERTNPIGRVPALMLPGGETLIDSAAILDHFDERAGPEHALVPAAGAPRRRALYLLALSCGTIERAMVANAERRRPVPLQMPDRLARLLRQTCQGFEALDRELAGDDWFIAGHPMQPDMTTAVGVTFVRHIFPDLIDRARIPRLDALTGRCEALPAFRAMQID